MAAVYIICAAAGFIIGLTIAAFLIRADKRSKK